MHYNEKLILKDNLSNRKKGDNCGNPACYMYSQLTTSRNENITKEDIHEDCGPQNQHKDCTCG